jgi:sensor histidine kinase YesM
MDGGEIRIGASARDGQLHVTVTDTGLGLGHGAARGNGIGIATTRERLQALYGERASLTLSPAPAPLHGTVARLTLPLETA